MTHAIKHSKPEDILCLRSYCNANGLNYREAAELFGLRIPKHIISVKARHSSYWPFEDAQRIIDARARYQAGRSEICQGKQFGWYVLYEIPRTKPVAPRPWFMREA